MKLTPNQVKRSCKRSLIGPSRMIQGKNPRTKKSTKRHVQEVMEPQWLRRVARGGGTHGRAA